MANALTHREIVAHHEAAHSVIAVCCGPGVSGGIDLNAATSVAGAFGNTKVYLFAPDASQPIGVQERDALRNAAIICAGAASDAKLHAIGLNQALVAQPGDHAFVHSHLATHPCVPAGDIVSVVAVGLATADFHLAKAHVWDAVESVATACLSNGGTIDAATIRAICGHLANTI